MSSPPMSERLPVDPGEIERGLMALWKSAGADETGGVVTRACLWNIVAHVEQRKGHEGNRAADRLLGALHTLHERIASRTLLLETRGEEPDKAPLESWVSASCALSGEGGKYVCSEEVTLLARGTGDRHLPSLVHALLVPDLPTAVLFFGLPPEGALGPALTELADRLVIDADASIAPDPLSRLRALPTCRLGVIDLGWLDTQPTREALAERFEQRAWSQADVVRAVRVAGDASTQVSRALLGGWITRRLGGSPLSHWGKGWISRHPTGQQEIDVEAPLGAPTLELELKDETLRLEMMRNTQSSMHRVAQALMGRGEDRSFAEAVEAFRV